MPEDPSPVPARTLVTGATGMLGSAVVAHLLAAGGEVLALARDAGRARDLLPAHPRLSIVTGDVTAVDSYRRHLPGLAAVIHTAAYFREYYQPGHDPDLLHRTNVTAVEDLIDASAAAGVPVVVHTSSTAVLGRRSGQSLADEDTPADADWESNGYRASKVRAEQAVARACARTGLRVPLVLPGWMWGPGDAGPTSAGRLFLAVARSELRAVPRVGNHLVDARDVAAACVQAAIDGQSLRRYVVAGSWYPLPEICARIAAATEAPTPRSVPAPVAMTFATLLEFSARLRRRPPIATRAGVRVLVEGNRARYSSQRAVRELGVSFRPLADTLADEAAWYRAHGLLPPPGSTTGRRATRTADGSAPATH
ncbi:NAD-dependent epimerase/dehydratase family protein [Micromonospora sp. CA-240977]|uniref:NAD-dependent epimerase/dehydratase family protein n=1 Tax=Micromonospora sp. CA-240977 TaxID=3239957 RepID=UPI003D8B9005